MQNLKLERPLVCFDLETTGKDPQNDRIVQVALVRVLPSGERPSFASLVNPGRPIPRQATDVHGITDDDVRDAPAFAELWPRLRPLFDGADLAGFNIVNFDLPLLGAEVARAGGEFSHEGRRLLDAMRIFHAKEPRNLAAAVRFYCGREMVGAHDALADTLASLDVLDAQLARYDDLPRDLDELHSFCNPHDGTFLDRGRKLRWDDAGEVVLCFGKHNGRRLREMVADPTCRKYLEWLVGADFPADVKVIIGDALDGVMRQRESTAGTARAAVPARRSAGGTTPAASAAPAIRTLFDRADHDA